MIKTNIKITVECIASPAGASNLAVIRERRVTKKLR
jgi:hypothetical protein